MTWVQLGVTLSAADIRSKTEPKAAGADLPPEFNALRYNARFEDANEPFFHGLAAIRSR